MFTYLEKLPVVNISAVKSEIKRLREPAYSSSDALGCCPKTMGHIGSEVHLSNAFRQFLEINELLVGIEAFQQATIRWIRFYGCNLASWKQFQPKPINDRYVTPSISQPNRSG